MQRGGWSEVLAGGVVLQSPRCSESDGGKVRSSPPDPASGCGGRPGLAAHFPSARPNQRGANVKGRGDVGAGAGELGPRHLAAPERGWALWLEGNPTLRRLGAAESASPPLFFFGLPSSSGFSLERDPSRLLIGESWSSLVLACHLYILAAAVSSSASPPNRLYPRPSTRSPPTLTSTETRQDATTKILARDTS